MKKLLKIFFFRFFNLKNKELIPRHNINRARPTPTRPLLLLAKKPPTHSHWGVFSFQLANFPF